MRRAHFVCAMLTTLLGARVASADPCGMVPPVIQGMQDPIERVGAQRTYVFYSSGIETFVIRPGFRGQVEEFGMLIPFPKPPAIRKVDDKVFSHIAAAVDPPEVRVWVRRYYPRRRSRGMPMPAASAKADDRLAVRESVRVLRKEAVGMYEVAVLEAGSAKALERWMTQHSYKYPKGMDQPVNDYVKAGWCFVAVKTRVGPKSNVNPRPGMRKAKTGLPPGGSFSGHVQGMGFRFKTDGLVVPMRLSAFNKGRLRNIVYILSTGPKRIKRIPQKYVMRQLPGWKIYRNLTRPLPLRVFGGTFKDLQPYQKQSLKSRRNPVPHNGIAAELFASDVLAARKRRLSHPFEEKEKVLLNIGEELGMRGAAIDALNAQVLGKARKKAVNRALRFVKRMSLSVVDGDFARDTVAKANLQFAWFRMPRERNNTKSYNARTMGPDNSGQGGVLYRGSIENMLRQMRQRDWPGAVKPERRRASLLRAPVAIGLGLASIGLASLLGLFRRRRLLGGQPDDRRRRGRYVGPLALIIGASLLFAGARDARAEDAGALVAQLKDAKKASAAMQKLVNMGGQAISKLVDKAFDGTHVEQRGWCIVALTRIGQKDPQKSGKNIG
ncbi:MAG: DUF2330 domain-containing protein, partial [Myxococcales bacterium]|nr:DUF2330 domain-containing protein [Myxococcales bacterium]